MTTRSLRGFAASVTACSLFGFGSATLCGQGDSAPANAAVPRVVALRGNLEVGGDIRVDVSDLGAWTETHDPTKLVPFIQGRAVRGNYPMEIHAKNNDLLFELAITPANKSVWIDLLGAPHGLDKSVEFSVGLEGNTPFPTSLVGERQPSLVVIERSYAWLALMLVAATVVAFVMLARRTGIIRDANACAVAGRLARYNLGRTQMAFWFFLTFTSYIVIWLITDSIDTITPSLLGLMGISAGTALSEVLIDANKDQAAAAQFQSANAERQALEQGVAELQVQLGAVTGKPALTVEDASTRDSLNRQLLEQRTRLGQLTQQLKTLAPAAGPSVSKGFIRDILTDGDGYSFHRFQIAAWTIALGGVFVSAVYYTLTMPEFSATMLGLMGMSSGTYIGFKFPETR